MKPFQSPLIVFLLSQSISAAVLKQGDGGSGDQSQCRGSLHLFSTDNSTQSFIMENHPINQYYNLEETVTLSRAEIHGHGCSCFIIFQGRNGRTSSHILENQREIFDESFKVKSFKRIICPPTDT